ncbi:Carboxyl-terminal protease [hydrothermal vent metagenome]|uniref:Carboxyl-terminal protease n=1 Tax=hydrothermal vent metagenome TaxID=652676 RepID=A0A3B1E6K4_9ZZZZ
MIYKKFILFFCLITILYSQTTSENLKGEDKPQSRLEAYTKLQNVVTIVESIYVDDIKVNAIINKAIKGLMNELDAHSSYMDAKVFKEFNVQMKGEFGGLGIVVGMRNGALTVISPLDDTPAFKAGIQSEDIILKINDKSTLNMTLNEAVSIMRGKVGTPIDITIIRKKSPKPIKIHIVRDKISIKSVSAKTIDDILYLRIVSFDNNVATRLKRFIKKYSKNTKGIVIDLRNNPGGSLEQAIKTVDMFVDKGIIVSQKGRNKKENRDYKASKRTTLTNVPMVVLVNGGSASASEIVSGALQDHKRAVIIGKKTFGKGSVQMIVPINKNNSEAIKLTIAKYYLPSGRTIQAKGVTPDIESFSGNALHKEENEFSIKEKDLKKHLKGELEKIDKKNNKKKVKQNNKSKISQEELYKDNQLKTAVDILRSLILIKG